MEIVLNVKLHQLLPNLNEDRSLPKLEEHKSNHQTYLESPKEMGNILVLKIKITNERIKTYQKA